MEKINYLDGFSGYGGFHLGFEKAGWEFNKCYFSEIDKHAIANYSYNFPNSIYAGSIDTICTSGIIADLDLFTFGWPCQDNSIAGKRKGQSTGTRSGLLYEAVKIINKFRPRNFVAENVPGLLSVNKGIDIIESLKILSYLNESCPQYDIEMQLLNTRWFLPQNRERLYFVGHLRGSGSSQILPIGYANTEHSVLELQPKPVAGCLTKRGAGEKHSGMQLIRLDGEFRVPTPTECEKLQGLPINWTQRGIYDGLVKNMTDKNRYSLCGNGVSIPIVTEIATRLKPL